MPRRILDSPRTNPDNPSESMRLPAFQLEDIKGVPHTFPSNQLSLLCFVKEDCPTCRLVLPIIDHWREAFSPHLSVLVIGQSCEGNVRLASQHGIRSPLLDDSRLLVSFRNQIEVVPTLILADASASSLARVIGFKKDEWRELEDSLSSRISGHPSSGADWEAFPELRPGCGSLSADPEQVRRLEAELDGSRLRARPIEIGGETDVFEFLFEQGFTDGLPVIPPSPDRVLSMLAGTGRAPQDLVAVVPPNMGNATVEKIAINAVMAGCRPDYLPVVIAALEAVCTDEFNIHGIMATTMGASPVLVVNGPIRHRIEMNMKQGALGQGNRANATIGRALRLILSNVGGARPGGIERATLSSPLKFTMCFAEWEEKSPWEPLHVERGFSASDSVVTAFGMTSGPTLVVDQTSRSAAQLAGSIGQSADAAFHPRAHGLTDVLVVIPLEHVATLERDGYQKSDLRNRIQEVTAVPLRELQSDSVSGVGLDPAQASRLPAERLAVEVPKFASPQDIHIVVAGGTAGKFTGIFHGWSVGPRGTQPVSQRIEEI